MCITKRKLKNKITTFSSSKHASNTLSFNDINSQFIVLHIKEVYVLHAINQSGLSVNRAAQSTDPLILQDVLQAGDSTGQSSHGVTFVDVSLVTVTFFDLPGIS